MSPLHAVFAALALLFAPPSAAATEAPNVVLIVIDTLRADHLGSYGYSRPTSPRLDALAASGARFAGARATSGWTAPSVASILTGLYPLKHGVDLPGSRLHPSIPTLAQQFKAAGYTTVAYSANPAFVSPRQGFDAGFGEFYVLHSGVADDKVDTDIVPGGPTAGKPLKVAEANQVTDQAIEWLGRTDTTAHPFFLYAHYFDPHGGYYPPVKYAERFGVPADSPMLNVEQREFWKKPPGEKDLHTLVSLYDGEIAFTDAEIGRLLDALPESRPTLIVVTADHGEEFADHGGMSHGRTLWEEMLHVPLIFYGEGVKPGVVLNQGVTIADVTPSILELASLPPLAGLDGESLASGVRNGAEPPSRLLFADMTKAQKGQDMIHRHAALQGSWKLLQNMDASFGMYDLASDPSEREDRLAQERARAQPLETTLAVRDSRKKNLTGWRARPLPTVALSDEDKERMRALGYEP